MNAPLAAPARVAAPPAAGTAPAGREGEGRPRRARAAAAVGGAVALAWLALLPWPPYRVGSYGDDAVYVALGRALASGLGYREIFTVGLPAHAKYPPGLPALLAGLWLIFGHVDAVALAARVVNAAAVGLAAGCLWWYGRAVLRLTRASLAAFALAPLFLDATLQYGGLPLSEPYMLAGWCVALVLFVRIAGAPAGASAGTGLALILGLLLGLTSLFRTQAIALVPGFLLAMLLARHPPRRVLAAAAGAALPIFGWSAGRALILGAGPAPAPHELGYVDDLFAGGVHTAAAFAGRRAILDARSYLGWFAPYFAGSELLGRVAVGSLLALAVFGGIRLARRRPELVVPVLAAIALLLIWPYVSDRFMLPVLPFLGLMAARRFDLELARVPRRRIAAALAVLAVAVAAVGARQVQLRRAGGRVALSDRGWAFSAPAFLLPWTDLLLERVVALVRDNARPADRVLVDRPAAVWLYTGVPTVPPDAGEPRPLPPGLFLARRIRDDGVTLVVIGSPTFRSAADVATLLARCPGTLRPLGAAGGVYPRAYRVEAGRPCAIAAEEGN